MFGLAIMKALVLRTRSFSCSTASLNFDAMSVEAAANARCDFCPSLRATARAANTDPTAPNTTANTATATQVRSPSLECLTAPGFRRRIVSSSGRLARRRL